MVGIIQEQHADRTRLFMQWKKMDWPILVDSLNLLEVSKVPITLLIDESGIVRKIQPQFSDLEAFLDRTFEAPDQPPPQKSSRPDLNQLKTATQSNTAESWLSYADSIAIWGESDQIDGAIEAYRQALRIEADKGVTHFRLGVAYRKRYDSPQRQENDFQKAVEHWTKALQIDPNQYIWRRRIQQYGPRLDKPYSFYDWIRQARKDIHSRGEVPERLSVEPGGAEFAYPTESFESTQVSKQQPDPQGRILRDRRGLIQAETTTVPSEITAGESARVHVVFRPNLSLKAHWNNEVDDLELWINPPANWRVDSLTKSIPNPIQEVSQEQRKVDFEVYSPENTQGLVTVPIYALYYVCEDIDGTCLYRRQDMAVPVKVKPRK